MLGIETILFWIAVVCLIFGLWHLFDCFEPQDRP